MKNKNWFWGFFFLVAGIFVIASQTGSFGEIGVLSILAGVLLLSLTIMSIFSRNFFGIFMPLAFLYMIFQGPLSLFQISPKLLILAGLLISTGFSILFHSKTNHMKHWHGKDEHSNQASETIDDNNPYTKVTFASSSKYIHGDCLKSGQFISSFGELELFFDQAQLSPEGAKIFLDCSFGAIKIFVPKHWRVQDNMHASFGSVDNKTQTANLDENSPCLTLTGNVSFGGIEIINI